MQIGLPETECDGVIYPAEIASLTLTFENGMSFKIWLPYVEYCDSGSIAFWVAEDGSTYWMDMNWWDSCNMDPWYAIRWYEGTPAMSAYDARLYMAGGEGHETEVDSPAVDAGSKDWLNGGTTVSQLAYGYYQQDNIAPPIRGGYDNYDPNNNNEPIAWEGCGITAGTADDIDIGYHYWGSCFNEDDEFTVDNSLTAKAVTLRHPKQAFGKIENVMITIDNVNYYRDFHPSVEPLELGNIPYKKLAVSSNIHNNKEETIACFATNRVHIDVSSNDYEYIMLCYTRFRDDSQNFNPQIEMFMSYTDDEVWFSPSLGSVALATSEGEPTYLAALITWYDNSLFGRYQINVYRYQPDNANEKWHKIAAKYSELYDCGISKQGYMDVSLTVDGDDVIVFWTLNDEVLQSSICGYRIENASTISYDSGFATGMMDFWRVNDENVLSMLSADWDPHTGVQTARVVWQEFINNKAVIWPGWVTFDLDGQPDGMIIYDYENPISGSSSYSAMNPVVVVNRPSLPGLNMSNTYEAFAGYALGSSIKQNDCNVINSVDVWYNPVQVNQNQSASHDDTSLTYRAFGNTKHIWRYNDMVYLDNYILNDRETIGAKALKLTTNRENRTEIYGSYLQYYGDDAKIMIQQLEP